MNYNDFYEDYLKIEKEEGIKPPTINVVVSVLFIVLLIVFIVALFVLKNPIIVLIGYGIVIAFAIIMLIIDKKNNDTMRKARQKSTERRTERLKNLLETKKMLSEDKIDYILKVIDNRIQQKEPKGRIKAFIGVLTAVILPIWLEFIKKTTERMIIVSTVIITIAGITLALDWLITIPDRIARRHMEAMQEDLSYIRTTLK